MNQKDIDRINELYHKSKDTGLTEEEKAEQQKLRHDYIMAIRRNLRGSLDHIDVKNPDGSVTNLGKKYGKKFKNN